MPRLIVPIALALLGLSLSACKPKAHDIPAAPTPAPAVSAGSSARADSVKAEKKGPESYVSQDAFDVNKVPVTSAALPPFPYIAYPEGLDESLYQTRKSDFDEAYLIAGNKLRKVEGRIETHRFALRDVKLSEVAARRNYENLIKSMGGVKVNDVGLRDITALDNDHYLDLTSKLRFSQNDMTYDAYLVRKPDQLIWIALMSTTDEVKTMVVAEEPFKQTVGFVTADAMQSALASTGHVALYINFDTDKATIRPDGKPVVDEIVKLMNQDPSLKLTIEGHTDNSGDAKHNKTLSQQRADAVMGNLMAAGIAKDRLNAIGMGDTKPLADNKDEAGRAKNRRVELVKQN